ncbi:MAG: ketopantoate reductase family protein [Chloroflexia bacterium]|nr:ketopantoate reductase family protein [Chloroflexia bacterium]
MRIAVVGAGGTGGYFGGLLARAGRDVTFIARGRTLDAIRANGLVVQSRVEGSFTVGVAATDDPASVGSVDLILFCVKTYATSDAAMAIRPLVSEGTAIVSVQNGVDNEERIAEVVGETAVLGAIAGVSARVEAPGVIAVTQEPGGSTFGELRGGESARSEAVARALEGAGFGVTLDANMPGQIWNKFVFICAMSGVSSVARQPIAMILAYPETSALFHGVMEETAAVAHARGVPLPGDSVETWMKRSAQLNPEMYGPMYFDLERGTPLEVGSLNGAVVRLGSEAGIPTPLNLAIYGALRPYENGVQTPPGVSA